MLYKILDQSNFRKEGFGLGVAVYAFNSSTGRQTRELHSETLSPKGLRKEEKTGRRRKEKEEGVVPFGFYLKGKVHCGGEVVGWQELEAAAHLVSQSGGREQGVFVLSLLPFIQFGSPAHEMMPPTLRVCLPTSA